MNSGWHRCRQGLLLFWVAMCLSSASLALESQGREVMKQGQQKLQQADDNIALAAKVLKQGNVARKALGALRYKLAKTTEAENKALLQAEINQRVEQLNSAQRQGADLRESSRELKVEALSLFSQGMAQVWSEHLRFIGPLRLQVDGDAPDSRANIRAHNVPQRSVHPRMPEPRSLAQLKTREGMSLEVSELAGQNLPEGLLTQSFSISRSRNIFAHIESASDDGSVPLNQLHEWRLILSSLDGLPVDHALLTFSGHMPGHVHGLPTQPLISATAKPGVYKVSGVKFQMGGWWVIEFAVQMGTENDSLRFNVVLQ